MLYYEDASGQRTVVGDATPIEEALEQISEYLRERNLKLYYTRCWTKKGDETVLDFGSHDGFFILKDE